MSAPHRTSRSQRLADRLVAAGSYTRSGNINPMSSQRLADRLVAAGLYCVICDQEYAVSQRLADRLVAAGFNTNRISPGVANVAAAD